MLDLIKKDKSYKVIPNALPQSGGISAEITGSENKGRSLNLQHGSTDLTVLFLCKYKTQTAAFDTLCDIGNYLDRPERLRGKQFKLQALVSEAGRGLWEMRAVFIFTV